MDTAKQTIRDSLADKPQLLNEVLTHFDRRWEKQMEQKLYGAALFLNPAKFFAIKEKSVRDAARLRAMFNDVLWKMMTMRSLKGSFSRPLAIKDRARKNPVNWWGAYGGLAYELMSLAKKIVSLCCSASGCERNWSTFSQIHTKRRNRLEHKRLNNLVFVSYNRKMANRFAKLRELGSKGKKYNPLHLDEFQWENEWVDAGCEPVHQDAASDTGNDLTWQNVDEATGATQGLGGRNLPRAAAMKGRVDLNMLLLLQVKGLSNLGQLQFQLKMKCQVKRMMKWEMRVDLITKMMKRVVEVQLQGLSKWMMMCFEFA
ncbi:uncharacterized protein LOC121781392 [Salvia splendens]|uniref:uncharacterized protein LOC121781392 n=1 Tax=Salvia splendens TaxID=180675 RepID=UPI001C26885E|nr:uncharacterized protein LOC121781392 [Salvia splendens]